ncbi:MAG: SPOR domain-containing protein [Gammaproteobacteria bacterium]|nr:SPOR domain-containing protein [Gammaproteobacteria bacterium]
MSADARTGDYFDTPERLERQQLLLHLVRNAGEVIYLRGPDGAGKTLFARRMFEQLGEGLYGAWIVAGKEPDFVAAVNRQLSIATDRASPWPDSLMFALGEREMLLVVDDADAIDAQTLSHIAALRQRGGHILLIGRGGLPPGAAVSPQFMDLPGFDAQQSAAFLRSRPKAATAAITDDVATALHRAAQGMPGPLLDALQVLATDRPVTERKAAKPDARRGPVPTWYLLAGAGVLLLGTVLWFQDSINEAVAPGVPAGTVEPIATVDVNKPATDRFERDRLPVPPASGSGPVSPFAPPVAVPPVESPKAVAVPASTQPVAPVGEGTSADIDPLEAVMLDALAAAKEAESVPRATASADPSASAVTEPPAVPVSSAPPPKPAVPSTAAIELPARRPVEGTPQPSAVTQTAAATSTVATDDPAPVPTVVAGEDAARSSPAPVEDRSVPAAAAEARAIPPAAQSAPQPAPVVDRNPPKPQPQPQAQPQAARVAEKGWLETRTPSHFTLQLVGARDRASIDRFVRRHGIQQPYAVFQRELKGAPWYSLVAGDYPDRAAAIAARARLPAGLERSGVWPRTFESIYKLTQ